MVKKAQISTEFIIVMSIALLFFSFLLIMVASKNAELGDVVTRIETDSDCLRLSSAINSIVSSGPGSYLEVEIDDSVRVVASGGLLLAGESEYRVSTYAIFKGNSDDFNVSGKVALYNDEGVIRVQ